MSKRTVVNDADAAHRDATGGGDAARPAPLRFPAGLNSAGECCTIGGVCGPVDSAGPATAGDGAGAGTSAAGGVSAARPSGAAGAAQHPGTEDSHD